MIVSPWCAYNWKMLACAAGRPPAFPFCLSHGLDAALNSTEEMRSPQTQLQKTLQWVARLSTEKMSCSSWPLSLTHPWTHWAFNSLGQNPAPNGPVFSKTDWEQLKMCFNMVDLALIDSEQPLSNPDRQWAYQNTCASVCNRSFRLLKPFMDDSSLRRWRRCSLALLIAAILESAQIAPHLLL